MRTEIFKRELAALVRKVYNSAIPFERSKITIKKIFLIEIFLFLKILLIDCFIFNLSMSIQIKNNFGLYKFTQKLSGLYLKVRLTKIP
jgi:hypothetical protein